MKSIPTYEEALQLDELPSCSPRQFCDTVGMLIDTGSDRQEVAGVEKGIYLATLPVVKGFDEFYHGVLYFFEANGWAALQQLRHPTGPELSFSLESKEREQEIWHLRKALSILEHYDHPELIGKILTNLANAMNHVGRFVEAIDFWKRALVVLPDFGMAVGNMGWGVFHFARVLYDEGHRFHFCRFAYVYLLKGAATQDMYHVAKQSFEAGAKSLADYYGHANLMAEIDTTSFSLGRSQKEQQYRRWCIKHTLFLNPLNDITNDNIVSHDCFFLPGIKAAFDEPPLYHVIYNQIKQEYASARYLLFEGITTQRPHFSDKGNYQVDTLDYAVYSINIEKLKIAFRLCYSIFDKIAYLLNDYFEIGLKSYQVNFRNIWYKKGSQKPLELHQRLLNSQNLALRGLYWMGKDFAITDAEPSSSLLPEASKLVGIRNFIEHKSFIVTDLGDTLEKHDGITMQINREDLVTHTLDLMKMARAAMMYVAFAIHIEEEKAPEGVSFPIYMQEMSQRFKT